MHAHGCRRWFNVARDTVTHEILAVYKIGRAAAATARRHEPAFRLGRGGRIDRDAPLRFTFNGQRLHGLSRRHARLGAAGQRRARSSARSFKYHRPRGIVAAGAEEPNALVQLGAARAPSPTLRATEVELYDGLSPRASTAGPAPSFDCRAVTGCSRRCMPPGFYYKTFMWPQRFWMTVRARHPQGRRPRPRAGCARSRHATTACTAHCDVLVVGAGPAGLAAALAAGRGGARVILADEQAELGGALLGRTRPRSTASRRPPGWRRRVAELRQLPETCAAAAHHRLRLLRPQLPDRGTSACTDHLGRPRARTASRAAPLARPRPAGGARHRRHERPLVFGDNDRPGIMLAGAVSRPTSIATACARAARGASSPTTTTPTPLALDLHARRGCRWRPSSTLRRRLGRRRCRRALARGHRASSPGHAVIARPRRQARRAASSVARLDGVGRPCERIALRPARRLRRLEPGRAPVLAVGRQAALRRRRRPASCRPTGPAAARRRRRQRAASAWPRCLGEGTAAGRRAARAAGFAAQAPTPAPHAEPLPQAPIRPPWLVPSDRAVGRGAGKQFVDLQNDVTAADIAARRPRGLRARSSTSSATPTAGIGTDQGKHGQRQRPGDPRRRRWTSRSPQPGTTTFRPHYTPVTFGALAGRDRRRRCSSRCARTPLHAWHVAHGAAFEDVGQWKRPWYYPASRRRPAAGGRAASASPCATASACWTPRRWARSTSRAPTPREFLNRVYTNAWQQARRRHAAATA